MPEIGLASRLLKTVGKVKNEDNGAHVGNDIFYNGPVTPTSDPVTLYEIAQMLKQEVELGRMTDEQARAELKKSCMDDADETYILWAFKQDMSEPEDDGTGWRDESKAGRWRAFANRCKLSEEVSVNKDGETDTFTSSEESADGETVTLTSTDASGEETTLEISSDNVDTIEVVSTDCVIVKDADGSEMEVSFSESSKRLSENDQLGEDFYQKVDDVITELSEVSDIFSSAGSVSGRVKNKINELVGVLERRGARIKRTIADYEDTW